MSAPPDKDQRTLPPTPKRISDFRKRGDVALSRDSTMVLTMAGGVIGTYAYSNTIRSEVFDLFSLIFRELAHLEPLAAVGLTAHALLIVALPACAGALLGFLSAGILQLGTPPAFKSISFDLTKSFQLEAWMRLVNLKAIFGHGLKATAKIAFVGGAAAFALIAEHDEFLASPALESTALGLRIFDVSVRVFAYAGGALALLAAVELIRAKRELAARMRMTPEEMKREMKEQDGNPEVKRKRRQRMRELSKRKLVSNVKSADVVIVNPTEYAVAIRYRAGTDRAPRVVAKGRGAVAERIRELARNNGIPILAQPPLARLLHKVVKEGREIPADTYQAVALVLAYVHRLKKRAS